MLLLALIAAIQATSPASQVVDRTAGPAAALIGNSIEVRYGDNVVIQSFAADGTFKIQTPDGARGSGDWLADERHMCWITKVPALPPGQNLRCEAMFPDKKVGDTWTQMDSYGEEATVSLIAGDRLANP